MNGLPVNYHMNNYVNGDLVEISGTGSVSSQGLSLDLSVSKSPPWWTGIIVPCICSGPGPGPIDELVGVKCNNLMGMTANGYETTPGTYRVATLYKEDGDAVAAVRAKGRYEKTAKGFDFAIEVNTKSKQDPIIETLDTVEQYSFLVLPVGPGQVEVQSNYT